MRDGDEIDSSREWLSIELNARCGWVKAILGVEVEIPPLENVTPAAPSATNANESSDALTTPRPEISEGGRPPAAAGPSIAPGATLPTLFPSRWGKIESWGRQSFSLHLLCEWEHGHFLHERYAYPIFKPRETIARLAPLYQKLLSELAGEGSHSSPNLFDRCPHPIPVDKIREDLGIAKKDYRLDFRDFDLVSFMRSCCHQAFDPSMHTTVRMLDLTSCLVITAISILILFTCSVGHPRVDRSKS